MFLNTIHFFALVKLFLTFFFLIPSFLYLGEKEDQSFVNARKLTK